MLTEQVAVRRPRKRVGVAVLRPLVWFLLGALTSAVGWVSVRHIYEDAAAPVVQKEVVSVTATSGVLEHTVTAPATVVVESSKQVRARAVGTITARSTGDMFDVAENTSILDIDLRPVVALQSQVPFFRPLTRNMKGDDVDNFQQAMVRLGYLDEPRESFDWTVRKAVKDWQSAVGLDDDGEVDPSEVVAFERLPITFRYHESVAFAAQLNTGDLLGEVVTHEQIVATAPIELLGIVQPDQSVQIVIPGKGISDAFEGVVTDISRNDTGSLNISVHLASGTVQCVYVGCADLLDDVPAFQVAISTFPKTEGVLVPVSAIRTGADGKRTVLTADNRVVEVVVTAQNEGMALVEGVESGTELIVG